MAASSSSLWNLASDNNNDSDMIVHIQPLSDEECVNDEKVYKTQLQKEMNASPDIKTLEIKPPASLSSSTIDAVSLTTPNLVTATLPLSSLADVNMSNVNLANQTLVNNSIVMTSAINIQRVNSIVSSNTTQINSTTLTTTPPTIPSGGLVQIGVSEPQWIPVCKCFVYS